MAKSNAKPIYYWESYGRFNRTGFYRRVSTGRFHQPFHYWESYGRFPELSCLTHGRLFPTDRCFQARPEKLLKTSPGQSSVLALMNYLTSAVRRSRFTSTRERQSFSEAYPSRPNRDLISGVHSASFIHGFYTPHSSF